MSLAEIKSELVDAHRRQDWELAKILSQKKSLAIKTNRRACVVCGLPLTKGGNRDSSPRERCAMHARIHRFYGHTIANA